MTVNQKDILILFLINSDPGIKDTHNLTKFFDRVDFPAKIGETIDRLLAKEFIAVIGLFSNGTPFKYATTDKGKDFINKEFKGDEILKYILTLDNPEFLHELTKLYIDKANRVDGRLPN